MTKHVLSFALILALAGCGGGTGGGGLFGGGGIGGAVDGLFGGDRTAAPAPAAPAPGALDDSAAADTAGQTPEGGLILGTAVASLGDASVPGLWIETPLVTAPGPGRVVGPDGRTVAVTLRPSGGAPGTTSSLSLEAMQSLGLGLADLPTVTVISDA